MPKSFSSFLVWLFGLLLVFALLQARANESARVITSAQWQQVAGDKAFGYKNDKEKFVVQKERKQGALEKALIKIARLLNNGTLWRVIWVLIGLLAIYVIYKLVLSNEHIFFTRKKKAIAGGSNEMAEEMGVADWEALLQSAINNNDLHMAVRYSYMWLLQLLQESELIKYREDKTNFDYSRELEPTAYKKPFRQLSRQYEYVVYGNYRLSQAAYNEYIDQFNAVKKQLGR